MNSTNNMPFSQERFTYLLEVYSSRKATPAEIEELLALLQENGAEALVNDHIRQLVQTFDPRELQSFVEWEVIYRQIQEKAWPAQEPEVAAIPRLRSWARMAAAACILLTLSAGVYYLLRANTASKDLALNSKTTMAPAGDAAPGVNGAILTLANGQQIVLDSAGNGILATQGSVRLQNQHGRLSYYNEAAGKEVLYNTMTTTKGRQYQLVLADGSKVWLNAASSVTYPTAFTGRQRKVSITGEAYLEIAQNAAKPFLVSVNGMEIQVLGTAFNINAYDDEESAKTTLYEGRVKLTKNNASTYLIPGQQAQLNKTGTIKVIDHANLEEVTAWKDGLFIMNKADIGSIMRQIARWYDVEIIYPEGIPPGRISGDIPRNMNLSKVLEVLELSGVHFTVAGKRVEVKP